MLKLRPINSYMPLAKVLEFIRYFFGFQWIKIVAPHLVLVLATWLYTIVGASVFYSIEQPHEADQKNKSVQKINEIQSNFLEFLWNLTTDININETQFAGVAVVELDRVLEATFKAFEGGVTADDISNNSVTLAWTYYSAVFFSTTVITTIGKLLDFENLT